MKLLNICIPVVVLQDSCHLTMGLNNVVFYWIQYYVSGRRMSYIERHMFDRFGQIGLHRIIYRRDNAKEPLTCRECSL